jgi:hypothetical protein
MHVVTSLFSGCKILLNDKNEKRIFNRILLFFFEKKVIRFQLFLKILMEHFPKQFKKCLDRFLESFTI